MCAADGRNGKGTRLYFSGGSSCIWQAAEGRRQSICCTQEKTGGTHSAVVTAVSKVAFNQAVDSVRAGGTVVAVGLPSEYMELSIVKTVLDGIRVVGSLVGTRKDLEEAFDFGAQGLVVPVVETVPVDTAVEVFDQMEKGEIQGRKVLDFTK